MDSKNVQSSNTKGRNQKRAVRKNIIFLQRKTSCIKELALKMGIIPLGCKHISFEIEIRRKKGSLLLKRGKKFYTRGILRTAIIALEKQDESTGKGEIHLISNGTFSIVLKSKCMPRR